MKPFLAIAVLASPLVPGCLASPGDVIIAAMRLSEQPNYSWVSTIADDVRTYEIEGKTTVGGYTWVRLPSIPAIARRLGRSAEVDIEAIFHGADNAVIRTDRGWSRIRELPERYRGRDDGFVYVPRSRGAHAGMMGFPGIPVRTAPRLTGERIGYSNAQFGVSHPHEELAIIVSSHAGLHRSGATATGTLSDLGAQLLLVREGQEEITPLAAAGRFQLHLAGGVVVRYRLELEGILAVDGSKVHVRQSATTVVKAIGTTEFAVPDEVRRKLGF